MAAPTAQYCAKNVLGLWGITSLDPSANNGNTSVAITATDLENVANVLTQAIQVYWSEGPAEIKNTNGSGYLNAPTNLTLTTIQGSTVISGLATYAAWMIGCTIRVSGDSQDNELMSSTALARPYNGTGGAQTATIYGDCVVIDDTIETVNAPLVGQDGFRMQPAYTREDFMQLGQYPVVTDGDGFTGGMPFFFYSQKPISTRPYVWFVDGAYSATLDYVPRKLRFSPMPSAPYVFGYPAMLNPIRITVLDIDDGDHVTDPGKKLPIADSKVESILLPIARQIASGYPQFHNSDAVAEIARAYKQAMGYIRDIKGQGGNRPLYVR